MQGTSVGARRARRHAAECCPRIFFALALALDGSVARARGWLPADAARWPPRPRPPPSSVRGVGNPERKWRDSAKTRRAAVWKIKVNNKTEQPRPCRAPLRRASAALPRKRASKTNPNPPTTAARHGRAAPTYGHRHCHYCRRRRRPPSRRRAVSRGGVPRGAQPGPTLPPGACQWSAVCAAVRVANSILRARVGQRRGGGAGGWGAPKRVSTAGGGGGCQPTPRTNDSGRADRGPAPTPPSSPHVETRFPTGERGIVPRLPSPADHEDVP